MRKRTPKPTPTGQIPGLTELFGSASSSNGDNCSDTQERKGLIELHSEDCCSSRKAHLMNDVDLRSPKVAATCRHPLEAEMCVNELRAHGIEAQSSSTTISNGAIEFAQIDAEVVVPAEQLEEAKAIVERLRNEQANIDWSQVDVGEMEVAEVDRTEVDETASHTQVEEATNIERLVYPPSPSLVYWFSVLTTAASLIWLILKVWFA